jgi:diphthine-ammonia ligase
VKVATLYSGGKDSNRALHWAQEQDFDVKYLVTMFPRTMDSLMYHTPMLNLVELQSQALKIPLVRGQTKGVKIEDEIDGLKSTLKALDVGGVVTGALESVYQKSRVDLVCSSLGLESYAPFWHSNLETHLKETIDLGFDVRFVGVAALGLDESWLGRTLDYAALEDLKELHRKYDVNLGGEGGEYETFVCDGPTFSLRIQILKSRNVWDSKTGSGHLVVDEAKLVQKKVTW